MVQMMIKVKTIVAMISAFALLTTGTFAFQQTISKTNEFIGQKEGVTLHDDFDPKIGVKDVYVENQGSGKVYVRVKLDEAMNITSHTWRPGAIDSGNWVTHTYGSTAENCGHSNAAGAKFHDYFTWTMGGWKYYKSTDGSSPVVQDTTVYDGTEPGVKATPNAQITTAAAFLAMTEDEQKAFIGWIYDTDGYAYWSQPLLAGEATGLLLHRVNTSNSLKNKNYYYAINVTVEVVDRADIPMWTEGAPSVDESGKTYQKATDPDGIEVIWIIVGDDSGDGGDGGDDGESGVKINGGNKTIDIGEVYVPGYTVTPAAVSVIWTSGDDAVASVDQDGKITGVSEGGPVTITITVELEDGNTYTDSIQITVSDGGDGGGDGTDLPVNPGPFTPDYNGNPATSDGFYFKMNFLDSSQDEDYHAGAVHLEAIISDNNYTGVEIKSVTPAKYAPYITMGNCAQHAGKPSILYNYHPAGAEWLALIGEQGTENIKIPVQVELGRGSQSATVTVNMIFTGSLLSNL